ncbi:uncharacterized protein LOC126672076 [Mercurialis annua]|uniref:uncharacterized protein LOC126672076 n=1 Tax=Mercurialis annua TaxID=3986 RepID=UPI00215E5AD4|nr:uncharacterized protein LOC126672076 [Mercurialis annua]
MEEEAIGSKRLIESRVIEKTGEVISAIKSAKHVDQVICALHSFAIILFPTIDSSLISGSLDDRYRNQVLSTEIPASEDREEGWEAFYRGAAFPTLARVLLRDVASDWLACFPLSAKKHVYDAFFVNGLTTEVVQVLVPCLQINGNDSLLDVNAVQSNSERLLLLCLLENDGVVQMSREFCSRYPSVDFTNKQLQPDVARMAQIIASIPDKARPRAPASLSSHLFFKQITIQLLREVQERVTDLLDKNSTSACYIDGSMLFAGETFSRICRRGSSDVLLGELLPRVIQDVRWFLSSPNQATEQMFEGNPKSQIWLSILEAIKDSYAVERLSEQLLHQLAIEHVTDIEAYWTIWLLFNHIIKDQPSVRSMFVDKFLFWKVFPVCCLRWIIQFAVLGCPPDASLLSKGHDTHVLVGTVQRLLAVWSKREFLQTAPVEQQAYITAAIGICMEQMSKEELDSSKDAMHSILQGVSCRLENPTHLVRKMASNVALVFSKVIDPKNPLYLDDSCNEENIDWEFGLTRLENRTLPALKENDNTKTLTIREPEEDLNYSRYDGMSGSNKGEKKKLRKLVDPDEIIDPATLNYGSDSDKEDDDASVDSDSSSDSSLQPYDLTDDNTDLQRRFTQLVDVVGALRKSDDADGVERALDVAEKLVRASPDELTHIAGDLARTLVQVRCSDLAVEGEEEPAEEKRQSALVALLVTSPFQSLDALNKLLYSPNVDISQRIMILDVMTEAAQELADAKTLKPKHQSRVLISTAAENQPWFLPSSLGPPGASSWREVSETGSVLNYSNRYERELPLKRGQIRRGKTRRWSLRSANTQESQLEWTHNKFPVYAAAFMLPAMQDFDKKRQGVDLLDRDFIVLGKLIYMLGVCMKCISMHPEANALAPPLLDMLRSRDICNHKEAYVRRAVLFAASCILKSLHPSYVASALTEGNLELSKGLEWIRSWALNIVETDVDKECYMMAMSCLQLHAEMALQASRALEDVESTLKAKKIGLPSNLSMGTIRLPYTNMDYR